jgi:branched-chain amino acid transport system substrate-binding protein
MKKLPKFFLVLVLVGTMAVLGLSSSALAADPKVIKIGYTAPFTGAGAEYGTNGWRGIQLALDEVNKKGISIKGEPYKIEIIRYDSICTPTEAVAKTTVALAAWPSLRCWMSLRSRA